MKTTTLFLVKKTLLVLGIMTLANLAKGQEIITDFCHEILHRSLSQICGNH